jgi:glyceraldehyde 3-phosphate dehydrogenase
MAEFPGTVKADPKRKALIINGTTVHVISSNAPEDVDYTALWH